MSQLGIRGVEFISVNTDAQALHNNQADRKVHIGKGITKGLGSGMNPELGRQAAEESVEELEEVIDNADMIFITCGLGRRYRYGRGADCGGIGQKQGHAHRGRGHQAVYF